MDTDLRDELCQWLSDNDIDPRDVPAGTVPVLRDGHIVVTMFARDADGRLQASPAGAGECATHERRVALVAEPPVDVARWLRDNDTGQWLVWSNQKGMWWRASHNGYTQFIEEAGRYSRDVAEKIIAQATCDGALKHERTHPYTGETYLSYTEVMVPAPPTEGAAL